MKPEYIRRLMALDTALASCDGMRRSEYAAAWGCGYKTIQRDHEVLRELTGDTCEIDEDGVWYYCHRRNRLFNVA